jgi:UDP-N-acetylmuramoylalanine--D-glutamate ligase
MWNGLKVVVIGAARQGLALARYLLEHGARVILNDRRSADDLAAAQEALADLSSAGLPLEWVLGGHPLDLLDGIDVVCVSGGVSMSLPLVVEAQARGIAITNDSQVFMEAAPCKVIGITGSAGKTTTTTLVGRITLEAMRFANALHFPYRKVWVGGNIGSPLISVVDEMRADDLAVMELSSFQLEIMSKSPQVASVLNITPNHLDRHATMEAYTACKANILAFQAPADVAILGRDDPGAGALASKVRGKLLSFGLSELATGEEGAFFRDGTIYLRLNEGEGSARSATVASQPSPAIAVMTRNEVLLRGDHNLLNVLAACTIAAAVGAPVEAMRVGVTGFTGVKHRLEFVRSWGGADWYNDSIATAPERAMAAVNSFTEPLVLLAGGRDKNLPWGDFASMVQRRVDHLILFGEAAGMILNALEAADTGGYSVRHSVLYRQCANLREAVEAAAEIVQPGDVVLLSPGGTSFDEFSDFEERGECFIKWVKELP